MYCKVQMYCKKCIARTNVLRNVLHGQTYCKKCIARVLRGPNVLQEMYCTGNCIAGNVLHGHCIASDVLHVQSYCTECIANAFVRIDVQHAPTRNRMKDGHPDKDTLGGNTAVTSTGCEHVDAMTQTQIQKAPPPFPWTPFSVNQILGSL